MGNAQSNHPMLHIHCSGNCRALAQGVLDLLACSALYSLVSSLSHSRLPASIPSVRALYDDEDDDDNDDYSYDYYYYYYY